MPLLPMSVQRYFESIVPPSSFSLKRNGTVSTKQSNGSYDSYTAYSSYFKFPSSYKKDDAESDISSFASFDRTIDNEFASLDDEETLPSLQRSVENHDDNNEHDDQIIDTNTKNRSLSLAWDQGNRVASSFRMVANKNSIIDDICELPEGISKSDIMVAIDIDDDARSSRVAELDEEDLDVEILHHRKHDSGDFSPRKLSNEKRRKFEEAIQQGMLDDLKSLYTATPKTAKLVLCVVITVLSDGTLNHTFWSGGRVGLTEIVLKWVMFNADDLQVYKRGRIVQKKDFGFGPLGLTENEGQEYLVTTLAPRATGEIISKIGNGAREDLLVEI